MNEIVKTQELKEFIKVLKENGFKVYAPKKMSTYCHFVKNGNIGYVERGDFGFNFSSVHKPNKGCGTGYSIHRDVYEPTIKKAEDCFCVQLNVKKYKDWEDYLKSPINRIIETEEV